MHVLKTLFHWWRTYEASPGGRFKKNKLTKPKGEWLPSSKETSTQTEVIHQAPEGPAQFLWLACTVFLGFPALCFPLALQHGWPAGKSLGTESLPHFKTSCVVHRQRKTTQSKKIKKEKKKSCTVPYTTSTVSTSVSELLCKILRYKCLWSSTKKVACKWMVVYRK